MKQRIDLLVVSKNGYASIPGLTRSLDIRQVVIDASVPDRWSTRLQKDCDSLHIPCHDVAVKGAFVMTLR